MYDCIIVGYVRQILGKGSFLHPSSFFTSAKKAYQSRKSPSWTILYRVKNEVAESRLLVSLLLTLNKFHTLI